MGEIFLLMTVYKSIQMQYITVYWHIISEIPLLASQGAASSHHTG